MISRRKLITTMAGAAGIAMTSTASATFSQGISSRGGKPQPRGKPSGRAFLARLTDVASKRP